MRLGEHNMGPVLTLSRMLSSYKQKLKGKPGKEPVWHLLSI